MKRRSYGGILLCLLCLLLCSGCGGQNEAEKFENAAEQLSSGEYEKAEKAFRKLIDQEAYPAESYRGMGLAQMFRGNYADACISLERSLLAATDQDSDFIRDVNLYLAYCRIRHGETDKALEIYNSMLSRGADPDVRFLRGRLYMEMGEIDLAEEDLAQAVEKSNDYALFINIYQLYDSYGKNADGSRYLEQALEIARREEDPYSIGLVSFYLGNYETAKKALSEVPDGDPDEVRAAWLLGKVYLKLGDPADARALYRAYVDRDDTAAEAYNGLALCDLADGRLESALENIEAGLALADENSRKGLLYNQILIYEQMHDWEAAKNAAAVFVVYYPEDEAGLRENEFLSGH